MIDISRIKLIDEYLRNLEILIASSSDRDEVQEMQALVEKMAQFSSLYRTIEEECVRLQQELSPPKNTHNSRDNQ